MNNYISKYNPGETHFKRNDPWPGAQFPDEISKAKRSKRILIIVTLLLVSIL